MLQIPCPHCGPRDENEFSCGGEAHIARPTQPDTISDVEWADYLFMRSNPKGALAERWCHTLGCRRWFNIASRARGVQAEAEALLERLSLRELAHRRAGVISYGDKRLLEIAVVLATEPRLVLLDEPTAGMTPEETRRVTALVRQLAESGDYTFLITEHDMDVVFGLADRILVMHRGEVLVVGTPDEVRDHPEVRRAYLGEEDETTTQETSA